MIARLFKTDKVFIISSQSILLSWPDAPVVLRTSGEIDAYPENAKIWEIQQKALDPKASEEINALYGQGLHFTGSTAFISAVSTRIRRDRLKTGTRRAITKTIDVDDRKVLAVAPCPEDIMVSKLAWLSEKDKQFVEGYCKARPFNREPVLERIKKTN